jgi:hypothetical protein
MKFPTCSSYYQMILRLVIENSILIFGSPITDNQFMNDVLNNLISDYDLKLAVMEKRVEDKEKSMTVEEIKAELRLCFERSNMNTFEDNGVDIWKIKLYSVGNSKENVVILASQIRQNQIIMSKTTET